MIHRPRFATTGVAYTTAGAAVVAGVITVVAVLAPAGAGAAPTASPKVPKPAPGPTSGAGDSGNGKNKGGGNESKNLVLSGDVSGLTPGAVESYTLYVENDNRFTVRIKTLDATVTDVTVNGQSIQETCGPANLAPLQVNTLNLATPGRSTHSVSIGLIDDASDACQDAVFQLHYTATVEKL